MSKKLYIASSLLAFMLIGCGGSNSGACCSAGIDKGETSVGNSTVVADSTGNTNTRIEATKENKGTDDNTPTSTVGVLNVPAGACPQSNPCNFEVTQNASNCDVVTPNLQVSGCELSSAEVYLKDKFNPANEIVVLGGTVEVTETTGQVTTCGLNVEVNIPKYWCGKELGTGKTAGFTGNYKNDDSVFVLITIANAAGCPTTVWKKAKIRDGKIILENLEGVTLPAKFTLFRVTEMPDRFSGMTGVFN